MIKKFTHRGLKRLYADDVAKGVRPDHVKRLRGILTHLDVAQTPTDLDLPGYRLHPMKGARKGEWAVSVSGNWRVTFKFKGIDVTNVNYEDYH